MRMKGQLAVLLLLLLLPLAAGGQDRLGRVVDGATGKPVQGAVVTAAGHTTLTDWQGQFRAPDGTAAVQLRAVGYGRTSLSADADLQAIKLTPRPPKGLYLTVYGIGAPFLRDPALDVIEKSKLNALVIDVKGDRGLVPYPSAVPLAARIGALKVRTVPDLKEMVGAMKAKGLFLIARIVTFKDDLLATSNPQWAVRLGGGIWKDREGLAWIDPYRREAWDYTLSIAEEAAAAGFDEIQFDYVRFPDAVGLVFSQPTDETSRVNTIVAFLKEARRRLTPYNVFLAMDILRLRMLEPERHRHRPAHRGPRERGRGHLADAVPVGFPVRHSGPSQSGAGPVRDRLQVAGRMQTTHRRLAGTLSSLAAGFHRLCFRRQGLRCRRDRQADQGRTGRGNRRLDAVESAQRLLDQ